MYLELIKSCSNHKTHSTLNDNCSARLWLVIRVEVHFSCCLWSIFMLSCPKRKVLEHKDAFSCTLSRNTRFFFFQLCYQMREGGKKQQLTVSLLGSSSFRILKKFFPNCLKPLMKRFCKFSEEDKTRGRKKVSM